MDQVVSFRMTSDAFIEWSMGQPKGSRYELSHGEVVAMASERLYHALVKGAVYRRLAEAVEAAGLACDVFPDGMAIRITADTVYEPDVAVRCGEPLGRLVTSYSDPLVVVEVVSPSTRSLDSNRKLADYFLLPSLRHYLVVCIDQPTLVHHERRGDGSIGTAAITSGTLRLDPPGITLDVASLFP